MADKGIIKKSQIIESGIEKEFDKVTTSITEMRAEMKGLIEDMSKLTKSQTTNTDASKISADIEKQRIALAKEYEAMQKKVAAENAKLEKIQGRINKATIKQADAVALLNKRLATQQRAEARAIAKTNESARAFTQLKAKLDLALKSYEDLLAKRAQGNTLTATEVKQLNLLEKEVKDLSTAYKTVDSQMATTTGGVRKASSSFDSLGFSVAQITRESPAFINSMNTGFMAISNNIPMLVDEINKLKRANVDLQAQGKPTKNVLKSVGAAFFSWQSLISAGIVLMTVFAPKLIKMAQEAMKGANELERMSDAMKGLDDSTKDSIGNLIKLNIRLSDVNTSQSERLSILKEVNDKYPELNTNIKNEEDAMFNLNKQIERYIELQINKQKAEELKQKIVDLTIKNKVVQEDLTKAYEYFSDRRKEADAEAVKSLSESYDTAIEKNRELIASGNSTVESTKKFNEEIAELDAAYENFSYKQIQYYQLLDVAERSQENLNSKTKEFKDLLGETPSDKIIEGSIPYYQELIDINEKWIKANGTEANIGTVRALQSQNEEWQKQIDLINNANKKGSVDSSKRPKVEKIEVEKLNQELFGTVKYLEQEIALNNQLMKITTNPDTIARLKKENEALGTIKDSLNGINDAYTELADTSGASFDMEEPMSNFDKFVARVENFKKKYGEQLSQAIDVTNMFFDNRIEKLEQDRDANDEYYDALIDAAEGNSDEQDRLQAEKELKDKEIREKQNKVAKKQAILERSVAVLEIGYATAKSIAKSIEASPLTGGLPWSAINAALGAAQIAAVVSAPLPQFAEGGVMDKDGYMMINDHRSGRQEFVERNGKIFTTTTKNAIVQGQKDDIIHKDLSALLSSHNLNNDDIYKASILTSLKSQGSTSNSEKMFDNALKGLKKDINQGIRSGFRNVNINVKNSIDLGWNKFKNDRL